MFNKKKKKQVKRIKKKSKVTEFIQKSVQLFKNYEYACMRLCVRVCVQWISATMIFFCLLLKTSIKYRKVKKKSQQKNKKQQNNNLQKKSSSWHSMIFDMKLNVVKEREREREIFCEIIQICHNN